MAAIDKIYGTRKQWNELHQFLSESNEKLIKYMYPMPEEGVQEWPLANFSSYADKWLRDNCPLHFVQKALRNQYGPKFFKD